jgi:hypothetical protein
MMVLHQRAAASEVNELTVDRANAMQANGHQMRKGRLHGMCGLPFMFITLLLAFYGQGV